MQSGKCKILLLFALFLLNSCGTPQRELDPFEVVAIETDPHWNARLDEKLKKNHNFILDPKIKNYFNSMSELIRKSDPQLASLPLEILIYRDSAAKAKSYSLPLNKVYLSSVVLKKLENDSEIAAWISFELGRVLENQVGRKKLKLDPSQGVSEVEFEQIFEFTSVEDRTAVGHGIRILYQAGYDIRGMQNFIEKTLKKDAQMTETLYNEMSRYPPTRNPILKTKEFLQLQPRIQKL